MTARYRFISTHRATYGVKRMCRVLDIRRQGYYEWLDAADARAERQRAEDALAAEITAIHAAHRQAYGSQRVTVLGHPVVASLRTLMYLCSSALEHPFRRIGAPVGAPVGRPA